MESKNLSLIENLKKIYKLDLSLLLNEFINNENFIDYYPLVFEIIQSSQLEKNQEIIELFADKIIDFCIQKFHFSINEKENIIEIDDEKLELASVSAIEDIFFKYLKLCVPNSSPKMNLHLFKIFNTHFIRILLLNNFLDQNQEIKDLLFVNGSFFVKDLGEYNHLYGIKQINLLIKLFNLVSQKFKSLELSIFHKNINKTIEFLMDSSLDILNKVSDESHLVKLCINNLSKICLIGKKFRNQVLEKVCTNLKCVSENEKNSSKYVGYLNKKRTESFVQDISLNLVTSLADFIIDLENVQNDKMNFLVKSEYWNLIQHGLAHTNSLTRKQALYLLKRTNDFADVNNLEIKSESSDIFDSQQVNLYQSNSKIWNDFFLCIELLEETSVNFFFH